MELYHALNRGVEKRKLFMEERDRLRFVHDLWEFNDADPTPHVHHSFSKNLGFVNPNLNRSTKGPKIVEIHGWCLMGNHYHLLLSELVEGGLSLFLRKLNVGYANYFNEKYDREGSLFQGRTKKICITSDSHFLHILHYIHLNPLDYVRGAETWRAGRISNTAAARKQLETYRWSSYADYCGKKKFPSVLTTDFMRESLGNIEKKTLEYLKEIDITDIRPFLLND
ncbi:MAG: hypothetical protein Q8R25_03150 [bacterium]|nr:hypothetical protein [bacterium]